MLWKTTLLVLAACTPNYTVADPQPPDPPPSLGDILANTPPPPPSVGILEPQPWAMGFLRATIAPDGEFEEAPAPPPAGLITEVRLYPNGPYNTSNVRPHPQVNVIRLPGATDILASQHVTIQFTTGGPTGMIDRDCWLVVSPRLIETGVNWGSGPGELILQMVEFDIILPFPAGQTTDYGPGDQFHRQPTSGLVQLHGTIRLTAPMYLQLIVEAPEENGLGFVVTQAVGLIPDV